MSSVLRWVAMWGLAAVAAGCGAQDEQRLMLREMATQDQAWMRTAPARYEIAIRYDCFCSDAGVRSVVDHGNAIDTAPAGAAPVTVEGLFAQAQSMLAHGYASASIDYDPALGYPTQFYIDPDIKLIDEEFGFHVTCFATGDAHCPAEPATLDP